MPIRPRWSALAPALVVVLLVVGTPAVLAQEEAFDRIAAETAAARELPAPAEVVEIFITPEELKRRLPEMIAEEYPPAEAEAEGRAWAAFGLVPAGTDLGQLFVDLLGEQVAGFYDPETDEMYVISAGDELGAVEEFTYSHEVVHALQDAHLGLGTIIAGGAERGDDEALAVTSLYEGDAMVASLDYLLANPALAARLALAAQPATPLLDSVPPTLSTWLLFPYVGGQAFVEALRQRGGWEAVNAAYDDLPASSEQILHPEKYFERDEPTPVAVPDLAPALGAGWAVLDEDALGELQIAVMLADLAPGEGFSERTGQLDLPEAATNAAAGWDGDRYALWANGEQEVLVWRSVWDSEEDATAFARALQAYDEARFGGLYEGEAPTDVALVGEGRAARVVQDGAAVDYVLAPSLDLADRAMAALAAG